jgi:hypothetical protein
MNKGCVLFEAFHFIHYTVIKNVSRLTFSRKETLASSPFPNLPGREHDFLSLVQFRDDFLPAPVFLVEIDVYLVLILSNQFSLYFPVPHGFPGVLEHVFGGDDFPPSAPFAFLERHRVVPSQQAFRGDFSRAPRVVRVRERSGESFIERCETLRRGKEKRTTTRNENDGFL